MSYCIWKYPLAITDRQTVTLPAGAQPLSVLVQDEQLFLYVLVDPYQPEGIITIRIAGTGNPIPIRQDPDNFIGTVSMPPFVWHVFAE